MMTRGFDPIGPDLHRQRATAEIPRQLDRPDDELRGAVFGGIAHRSGRQHQAVVAVLDRIARPAGGKAGESNAD